MRHAFQTPALLALLAGLAAAQPGSVAPAFEAADVHVSPPGTTPDDGFLPNGRVECSGATLLHLITLAYSVPPERVVGGPSWLDTDRFDVTAKAADASTSEAALRTMLQRLLEERFGLAIERRENPMPVYALVLARGGVARQSAKPDAPDCRAGTEENTRTLTCHNMTMAGLAERLPTAAPAYFDTPVVDRTGMKGAYDFTLRWPPKRELVPDRAGSERLAIYLALEKELGVKVESATAPTPVLEIARVNRTPAENPPGTTEKLGPRPTEFEVADIRPSRRDEDEDFQMNNGRILARAVPLREMIAFAYHVENDWVRGERWLESERFDIIAKTAPTESTDTLRVLVQALLAARFGLKIHRETLPVTVYALTVAKPKLKKADPAERASCRSSDAEGTRVYTCRNTTMAQLAEKLRDIEDSYLDHPVVDLTGIEGGYDFTLSWAPLGWLLGTQAGGGAHGGRGSLMPADRPVGYTIFEAIDRQLGLKLSAQKHPMPVVVVDHAERTPTEN